MNNMDKLRNCDPETYNYLKNWMEAFDYPENKIKLKEIFSEIEMRAEVSSLRDSLLMNILLYKYIDSGKKANSVFFERGENGGYHAVLLIDGKDFHGNGYSICEAFIDAIAEYKF